VAEGVGSLLTPDFQHLSSPDCKTIRREKPHETAVSKATAKRASRRGVPSPVRIPNCPPNPRGKLAVRPSRPGVGFPRRRRAHRRPRREGRGAVYALSSATGSSTSAVARSVMPASMTVNDAWRPARAAVSCRPAHHQFRPACPSPHRRSRWPAKAATCAHSACRRSRYRARPATLAKRYTICGTSDEIVAICSGIVLASDIQRLT